MRRLLIRLILSLMLLLLIAPEARVRPVLGQRADAKAVIVVLRRDAPGADTVIARARALGAHPSHVFRRGFRGFSARLTDTQRVQLASDPAVLGISDDIEGGLFAEAVPTGIQRIHATSLPALGTDVDVAVIDSGVWQPHEDLTIAGAVNCIGGACGTSNVLDEYNHGTEMAGIIAATTGNGVGVTSIAPAARIWSVKVFGASGSGPLSDVMTGLDWVLDQNANGNHIEVVNMSLGFICGLCTDDSSDPALIAFHQQVQTITSQGTAIVASGGNAQSDAAHTLPAAYDEVIAVSALKDTDGTPAGDVFASFSNYGNDIDLIAPGYQIRAPSIGLLSYSTVSGTSPAAAHVSGVAALVIGAYGPMSPAEVRAHLMGTGTCPDGGNYAGSCSTGWPGDPDPTTEPLIDARGALLTAPAGFPPDVDGDGVSLLFDNCPFTANADQINTDGSPISFGSGADVTIPWGDFVGDACDSDDDADGLPDEFEQPASPPGVADCVFAVPSPTDPLDRDTDHDLAIDGAECLVGSDPLDVASRPESCQTPGDDNGDGSVLDACPDTDSDGLSDSMESVFGTSLNNSDTDGDGLPDGMEAILYGTNPLLADSDADGCGDDIEGANLNSDSVINSGDKQIMASNFNARNPALSPPGDPAPPQPPGIRSYHWDWDINRDGVLNSGDSQVIAIHFNTRCP